MIYTIGNIAVSGNTLTGTGTNFKAPLSMIRVGCTVIVKSDPIQIFSITEIVSETELSVTPAASPDIPAGTAYSILLCDSISVDGLAQDVAEALRYFTGQESEIYAAVEYWKNYGDAAQVEALLTAIQAETAQSTANAAATAADVETTAAALNEAVAAKDAAEAAAANVAADEQEIAANAAAAAEAATAAALSEANAKTYAEQAKALSEDSLSLIGLGADRRDWPDCTTDPSAYIGFVRLEEATATGFPSIASGEVYLVGWLARGDGLIINGCFVGTNTRSLYTYMYNNVDGTYGWTRHARKDEVSRLTQANNSTGETQLWDGLGQNYIFVNNTGWGAYSVNGAIKLGINYGGTGSGNAGQARHNLAVMHEMKTTLSEIDLNTLTGEYSGIYWQTSSAGATDERHYPTHVAGALVVLKNGANSASGCTQIYYPYNNSDVYYVRWCSGSDLAWSAWVAYASHRETINGIGLGASPRHCSDLTGNPSAYIGFLRLTPAGTTGYPDVASDEGALSGYICCNDGEPSYSGLFVGATTGSAYTYRYSVGGGTQWQRIPRANDLSRFVQNNSTTRMYGPTGDRFFEIHTNGNWGVYSTTDSAWVPLAIAQGGTGATDAAAARTNLRLGATNDVQHQNLTLTRTSDGTSGWVAGGMTKSKLLGADGTVRAEGLVYAECNASSPTQITFSIYSPSEGQKYLSFNTKGQILAETAIFRSTYVNPLIIESVNPIVRFNETDRPSGAPYYSFIADGGNWRIQKDGDGHNGEYIISYEYANDRIVIPSLKASSNISAGGSFYAVSSDVSGNTFVSKLTDTSDNVIGQSEFRASNNQGQIVVRDLTSTASHKFFNFNKDGSFNAPNGLVTHTGADWSGHTSDNINKFKPIAGSTNGPSNPTVFGGFHVSFNGNYATQFAGRLSQFWARSIEAGVDQGWKRLLTTDDLNSSTDLTINSLTTTSAVKSGGGDLYIIGDTSDRSAMNCGLTGCDSTGLNMGWYLGTYKSQTYKVWFEDYLGSEGVMLNGDNGSVQLYTGGQTTSDPATLTLYDDQCLSTVNYTIKPTTSYWNRYFTVENSGTAYHNGIYQFWGNAVYSGSSITGDRYSVFEWKLDTGYLAYLERSADGSQKMQVNGGVHCTAVTQSSDRDLKDNIQVISDATAAIRKMNGYTYTLKENGLPYAGVIAQECMEAIPEAVGSFIQYGEELAGPTQSGHELREETRYLNVDYAAVTGLLVQVARETDDRVTALEEENASLRANIAVMDERITKLEALVQQLTGSEE